MKDPFKESLQPLPTRRNNLFYANSTEPNPILMRIHPCGYSLEIYDGTGSWGWNGPKHTIWATPGYDNNWQSLPVQICAHDGTSVLEFDIPWNYTYGVTDYITAITAVIYTWNAICGSNSTHVPRAKG